MDNFEVFCKYQQGKLCLLNLWLNVILFVYWYDDVYLVVKQIKILLIIEEILVFMLYQNKERMVVEYVVNMNYYKYCNNYGSWIDGIII